MARHRRPYGLHEGSNRLYERAPAFWLSRAEMACLPVHDQWQLASVRRRASIVEYAQAHGLLIGEAERRFLVAPDKKYTDRSAALRWITDHGQASGLGIDQRRRASLRQ